MKLERLNQKFDKLYKILSSESFLSMNALGGEIPFYISSYNPEQEQDVFKEIKRLKDRLKINGIIVNNINLFEIVIEMLENRKILDKIIEKESELSKSQLYSTLLGVLDVEKYLIPFMASKIKNSVSNIVFLTGIAQVYPFIRSHTILNNMQSHIKDEPTVMFFPGVYDGKSLSLFGKLKDDNYYRAFNLETLNIVEK